MPSGIHTARLAEVVAFAGSKLFTVPAGQQWVVTWLLAVAGGYATPTNFQLYRALGASIAQVTTPGDGAAHSGALELRAVFYAGEQLGLQISPNPAHLTATGFVFNV